MTISVVDLRILGQVAETVAPRNALLSSCLFQVLGISVILSSQLHKARRYRRSYSSRDVKLIKLHHHIIWLAREGLSITEVLILPYCQDAGQDPECRVMAAKMRATFYHIFCLFYNHPPVDQLQASPTCTAEPPTTPGLDFTTGHRGSGRESTVSESSYVTNPFHSPAHSPPPNYPIPPTPQRTTPAHPPGVSPQQYSSALNATFLLPPLNFIPAADNYFRIAYSLANRLLRGAHPLRLSVARDYTEFLHDCGKDRDWANEIAVDAVRAAYMDEGSLSNKEWEEVLMMVRALTSMAKRNIKQEDGSVKAVPGGRTGSMREGESKWQAPTRTLPVVPDKTVRESWTPLAAPSQHEWESTTPRSETRLDAAVTAFHHHPIETQVVSAKVSEERARQSETSSRSSRRGRQEGNGTEKERKRRAVERAELEVMASGRRRKG